MNEIIRNQSAIEKYKVFISGAYGAGEGFPHQIINRPFFGEKGECCTETFLMVGPFEMKEEANESIFENNKSQKELLSEKPEKEKGNELNQDNIMLFVQ